MQPIFPANRYGAHRILRKIRTQLEFRILQKHRQLAPERQRVVGRLSGCAPGQRGFLQGQGRSAQLFQQSGRTLLPERIAFCVVQILFAGFAVDGEQLIHQSNDACRLLIIGIELNGIDELATRVREAAGVNHLRTADVVVACIAVCLQKPVEIAQELLRPPTVATHAEVEDHAFTRRAILPHVSLVIAAALVVRLHTHRRFIGLDVSSSQQLALHRRDNRQQKLAHPQHRIVQRRQRDVNTGITPDDGLLTIERQRRAVFRNHRFHDHLIGENRLGYDALRCRSCRDSLLFAIAAGTLLPLDDAHEVLRRTNIEHLGFFVTDHPGLLAAVAAVTLLGRARDDLLDAFQMGRQILPARMLAPRLARRLVLWRLGLERFAFALRLDFLARYAWLQIQQLQLQIAQRLTALAVAGDAV